MKIQKLPVVCESRGHRCRIDIVVEAPVQVAIASMKAARCPECGSKKVAIEMKPRRRGT